jgi:hypothetical protein
MQHAARLITASGGLGLAGACDLCARFFPRRVVPRRPPAELELFQRGE